MRLKPDYFRSRSDFDRHIVLMDAESVEAGRGEKGSAKTGWSQRFKDECRGDRSDAGVRIRLPAPPVTTVDCMRSSRWSRNESRMQGNVPAKEHPAIVVCLAPDQPGSAGDPAWKRGQLDGAPSK